MRLKPIPVIDCVTFAVLRSLSSFHRLRRLLLKSNDYPSDEGELSKRGEQYAKEKNN
jgi:hypothetical protein